MNRPGPLLLVVTTLLLLGIASAHFRHSTYQVPYLPGAQQTVWQVEAKMNFLADFGPVQVMLTLPPEQSHFRFISENTASSGYGLKIDEAGQQRRAHWSKRSASGEQTLYYKMEFSSDPAQLIDAIPPAQPPAPTWDEPYLTAANELLAVALPVSADSLTLAQRLIQLIQNKPLDQNAALLLSQYSAPELLARLLARAGASARPVKVLFLEDGRRRQSLSDMLEVWGEDKWQLMDPLSGPVAKSQQLLLWQTDAPFVLEVSGGSRSRISFSVISQTRSALELSAQQSSPESAPVFSLYSLPIEEQSMFKLIMLLPVGALVVVFMRIMIGIKTSGTFMPVLIAMSFLQTKLLPGLTSFLLVISVGLMIRTYLSQLNLLLVARIAALVVLVIGIISVVSVVSYRLGLIGGLTITFFPMIILAWTIERMSIIWEEEGPKEVLIQGSGSLFVATLAYLLMDQPLTRHLVFNFPEIHLCILAIIVLVGRYTGYRLLELYRFEGMK